MPTTTFSVGSQANNQMVERASTNYATITSGTFTRRTTATGDWTYRGFDTPNYTIDVMLLAFDTSSLLDVATVTGATLQLYVTALFATDSRSVSAGYSAWDGTSTSDWTDTAETDAHAGTALSSITNNALNTFALTNVNNVNKSGITYLRVHVSGGQPTGANGLVASFYDHATNPEPQLIVTYTLPNDYYLPYESPRDGKKKRTSTFAI